MRVATHLGSGLYTPYGFQKFQFRNKHQEHPQLGPFKVVHSFVSPWCFVPELKFLGIPNFGKIRVGGSTREKRVKKYPGQIMSLGISSLVFVETVVSSTTYYYMIHEFDSNCLTCFFEHFRDFCIRFRWCDFGRRMVMNKDRTGSSH